MEKPYRTICEAAEEEIVIQKSRFIGRCFPVTVEKDATDILQQIRKQHWDANHNCFAYSIGRFNDCARYSDDGEPSGTAGLPMMELLKHQQLTDVLLVVTRYFGGVLLGTGGLIRAYTASSKAAIETAGIAVMQPSDAYKIQMDYAQWARLELPIRKSGVRIEPPEYAEILYIKVWVKQNEAEQFVANCVDWSEGRVKPEYIKTDFMAWEAGEESAE